MAYDSADDNTPSYNTGRTLPEAIRQVESSGRYGLLGPVVKSGDRAYGAYQVMGNNIPAWTKEVLGKSMTPGEFLKDQKAQDAVAYAMLNKYQNQYGSPQAAASMWFTGRPSAPNARDILGTSGADYVNKVMGLMAPPLGQGSIAPQMAQGSPFVPAPAGVAQNQSASQQPLQGGGQGAASGMAAPLNAPTPPPAQQLMQAPAFRPQINSMPLQQMMAAYPQLRGLLPLFGQNS